MNGPLALHAVHDAVCFGPRGSRDAGQLSAYACNIAEHLPAHAPGARVVVACADRYHFGAALLASWLRGFVVALPSNVQAETVHALARTDEVLALLHDQGERAGIDVRVFERPSERGVTLPGLGLTLDAPAVVAFTSGSTGAPEAHVKTLAQLFNETNALITTFELGKRRVVASVPPHHIYGLLFGILVPWLGGGSVSRTAPLLPGEVLSELKTSNAEVFVAAPPHLRALAEHEACAWPRVHRVFSSTAPLPEIADRVLADRGLSVTQVLGSTETGGIGYRTSCTQPWSPLPSVELRVRSDGALVVRSAWAAAAPGEWIPSADRVDLVDGGFVHLGRTDAVVKVGGHRVDLGSIEAALRDVQGVSDARAIAVETASLRGVELWAVVEARGVTVDALERALAVRLHPVTMPRRFRVVDDLPRAESGKVTREACLSLFDTWSFPREALADGSIRIRLSPRSGYFRGHFEDNPMLPGVVQLTRIVLVETQRRWPELGPVARMTRVKFKRPLAPGDDVTLTLERQGHAQVCFALSVAAQPATSGILHFRGASP